MWTRMTEALVSHRRRQINIAVATRQSRDLIFFDSIQNPKSYTAASVTYYSRLKDDATNTSTIFGPQFSSPPSGTGR